LLAGVSAETFDAIAWGVSAETSEGQARALLADLLDWHRREISTIATMATVVAC